MPMLRASALCLVAALAFGACAPVGTAQATASNDVSPAISSPSVPTNGTPSPPAPANTATPTPSPSSLTMGMTERQRSDWYWEGVSSFGIANNVFESLAEITSEAHLIVRGRVTGMQEAEIQAFGGPTSTLHYLFGEVTIDEVLKGTPNSQTPGTVLVARMGVRDASADDLPKGEVILFLHNYAQLRVDGGYPPSSDPDDRYYYSRPNGYQCVLRNIDGRVQIVDGPRGWEDAIGPFPSQLDGDTYDDVVGRVRAMTATT